MAATCGLIIGQIIGPINAVSGPVLVNDQYFITTRNQFFVIGFMTGLSTYIAGAVCKASLLLIFIVSLIMGVFYYTLSQIGEPEFPEFYFDGALEFTLPFFVGCTLILAGFKLVEYIWYRRNSTRNT